MCRSKAEGGRRCDGACKPKTTVARKIARLTANEVAEHGPISSERARQLLEDGPAKEVSTLSEVLTSSWAEVEKRKEEARSEGQGAGGRVPRSDQGQQLRKFDVGVNQQSADTVGVIADVYDLSGGETLARLHKGEDLRKLSPTSSDSRLLEREVWLSVPQSERASYAVRKLSLRKQRAFQMQLITGTQGDIKMLKQRNVELTYQLEDHLGDETNALYEGLTKKRAAAKVELKKAIQELKEHRSELWKIDEQIEVNQQRRRTLMKWVVFLLKVSHPRAAKIARHPLFKTWSDAWVKAV